MSKNLLGNIYGSLKVVELIPSIMDEGGTTRKMWRVRCKCGLMENVQAQYLLRKKKPKRKCTACRYEKYNVGVK